MNIGPQFVMRRHFGEFVPWAHSETIVAAVDPVAHRHPEFAWNMPAKFNCQIGNTAPRIQFIRCRKGGRRAGIETAVTAATMILHRQIGAEVERGKNFTEKKPGAEFPRHQVGVLALPAESRLLRDRFFHHRRGVDKQLHLARPVFGNPAGELA